MCPAKKQYVPPVAPLAPAPAPAQPNAAVAQAQPEPTDTDTEEALNKAKKKGRNGLKIDRTGTADLGLNIPQG